MNLQIRKLQTTIASSTMVDNNCCYITTCLHCNQNIIPATEFLKIRNVCKKQEKQKTYWKELTLDVVEDKSSQDLVAHATSKMKFQKKDQYTIIEGKAMKERIMNITKEMKLQKKDLHKTTKGEIVKERRTKLEKFEGGGDGDEKVS